MTDRVKLKGARRALVDNAALLGARQRAHDAQAELEELEAQEQEDSSVHVHIHNPEPVKAKTEDRIALIEDAVTTLTDAVKELTEKLAPTQKTPEELTAEETARVAAAAALAKAKEVTDEDKDPTTGKTYDSAALADSFTKVLAQAEVLVPGFRMPTFDAALPRKQTVDQMCQARRKCLDLAYATKDGQELIDGLGGTTGLDLAKMDCKDTALLFTAAAGAKAMINNRAAVGDGKPGAQTNQPAAPKVMTTKDLNKINAEFWAKQQASNAGA